MRAPRAGLLQSPAVARCSQPEFEPSETGNQPLFLSSRWGFHMSRQTLRNPFVGVIVVVFFISMLQSCVYHDHGCNSVT